MESKNFIAGQRWESRAGGHYVIERITEVEVMYPVYATSGDTFRLDGHFMGDEDGPNDLVRLVADAPDNNGWMKWHGGDMPVEEGTNVDVLYSDGEKATCAAGGDGAHAWGHVGNESDIVAYRLSTGEPLDTAPTPAADEDPRMAPDEDPLEDSQAGRDAIVEAVADGFMQKITEAATAHAQAEGRSNLFDAIVLKLLEQGNSLVYIKARMEDIAAITAKRV